MMNNLKKNFIFLSQMIGSPVLDQASGVRLGRIADVVATLREMYPRVSGLVVKRNGGPKTYLPWKQVTKVNIDGSVEVAVHEPFAADNMQLSDNEILLKETFWDKQIVDIEGSKVVRVNDLHLLKEDLNVWLVHMDVGISGLLRRLGCWGLVNAIVHSIISDDIEDRFISWKFVQPITSAHRLGSAGIKGAPFKIVAPASGRPGRYPYRPWYRRTYRRLEFPGQRDRRPDVPGTAAEDPRAAGGRAAAGAGRRHCQRDGYGRSR